MKITMCKSNWYFTSKAEMKHNYAIFKGYKYDSTDQTIRLVKWKYGIKELVMENLFGVIEIVKNKNIYQSYLYILKQSDL